MTRERRIELKIYRKRARRRHWKSRRNRLRNSLKKENRTSGRKSKRKAVKVIPIPENFSMASNRDEILKFFNYLKTPDVANNRNIHLKFDDVKDISHGSVTILLSIIGWLNDQSKVEEITGSFPSDLKVRDWFTRSGFIQFFGTIGTRQYEKGQNTIVGRGKSKTDPALSAKLIRKVSKTVWGDEASCKQIQGMIVELMANTINHAYVHSLHQKGWYLAVDHIHEKNLVKFCFVDNGAGILKTLRKKFAETVKEVITGSDEVLKKAFEGAYGSRTKATNRGRGLKMVKNVFTKGYIKSLKVITNDQFYDFESNITESLPEKFDGTFYFWEIDQQCNR